MAKLGPGFEIKDGKVVRAVRHLPVCEKIRQRSSTRVKVKRPGEIVHDSEADRGKRRPKRGAKGSAKGRE